jgi:two-component system, cell cycle sensor histidine kinase and response regulator CckA
MKEIGILTSEDKPLQQQIAELQAENERLTKALKQSEELFHRIFHASSNMMAIHTLKDTRFVDVNEAAASMGGFKREELIGRSMEDRGLLVEPKLAKQLASKLWEEGKTRNIELKLLTKDGETRTVLASTDIITLNNEPCMLAVSTDITELDESREYLDQIINCIRDPIFVKDREHRIVLVNDAMCTFAGKPREDLIGHIDKPGVFAASFWDQEEEVFQTGKDYLSEDTFTNEHGNTSTFMTKKSLLTDKKGNKQVVGILRDITEFKRLEAQFLQAQKMEAIGVLAGGVAHDFNNLLNVINGYAELVLDSPDLNTSLRPEIEQIQNAGKRAAALTAQLLAFSRKQILQPKIFNLNQIIADMSSMLRRLIGEDIQIVSVIHPEPIIINADPAKIQQVIINLLVNARDAMPNGGTLTIETSTFDFEEGSIKDHPMTKPGPYVMVSIGDNGVGMDAATQARIFEPFYTTKPKGKGTGLGLSTVYGIVEQSGGFISVSSELGKGTTIKIFLPRELSFVETHQPEKRSDPIIGGSETVLVAEDEETVRNFVCQVLRSQGYTVIESSDGLEALRISQDYPQQIHIVVTDVIMPGLGGRLLVSGLEKTRPGIKSLYISGHTDDMIVHHGILDPNIAFLQKPFPVESLLRKVRETLDK